MPNGKDYKEGVRDGVTDAHIDGLSKSVDELWTKVDQLPCGKIGAEVDAIKESLRKNWLMMVLLLGEQAAIIALIIKLMTYVKN